MAIYPYDYATTTVHGYEVGIIRSATPDVFADILDKLAVLHRPGDSRVIVTGSRGTLFGPNAVRALFPLGSFDASALDWEPYKLTAQGLLPKSPFHRSEAR